MSIDSYIRIGVIKYRFEDVMSHNVSKKDLWIQMLPAVSSNSALVGSICQIRISTDEYYA